MAVSLGIVKAPSCTGSAISGDRLVRSNFSAIYSVSSSVHSRWWRGRIDVGAGVISARRRREFLVLSCLPPDSSSPKPSSVSGRKQNFMSVRQWNNEFVRVLRAFHFSIKGVNQNQNRCYPGLSFRTSEENLRKAFEPFGKLVHLNIVMDKIANRPRGFAFLRYETEEESMKAIEGMHGKFLDGRVIFVEEAKPKSDLHEAKPRSDIHKSKPKPGTFRTW